MVEDQPTIISIIVVCQLLMLLRMRINQLERDGWIKQLGRGKYSLVDAVQGWPASPAASWRDMQPKVE